MTTTYCMLCRKRTSGRNVLVPRDESRRELWSRSTGVQFTSSSRICASHFNDSDFFYHPSETATKRRRLMPNAVPQKPQGIGSFTEHKKSTCGKNLFDFNSQTEQDVVDSGIAIENLRLQKQVAELKRENATLLKKLQEMQTLSESLKSIFTESQVRKLQNGGKRIKWNQDDITYASCLHAAGPRAYRHLLKKGFPLPCQSTLEKWLHSIEVKPGILELVIGLMEKAVNIDEDDKICILSFDEMRITSSCETDSSQGGVQQPRDYVQVAMAQGLRKSWKQPIFFDFDKAMTVPTLHMLIQKLYTIGYHVVGIVSDMCPTNLRLWTNLGVSHERTWFKHPSDSDMKVFVFADAAHLLKLIRNHFLDSGLLVGDKVITQQTVRQVMSHASLSEISSMWQVNEDHLNVRYAGRQKIKLATQLLSNSTASAIRRCQTLGIEIDNASETADFIQLANDWFDIFNVKLPTSKQPFGQSIDAQRQVLDEMTALMSKIIIPNGKKCWPFQKGIIISNTSLNLLHQYAAERYSMEHLITGRLSLDQLDQFFDVIWEKNDLHDHPTASEIKLRFQKYLLENSCLRLDMTEEDMDINIVQKEVTNSNENKEKERCPESPENYTSSSNCRDQDGLTDVTVQSELLETEDWELSEVNLEIKIEENEFVPIESEHDSSSSGIQNDESKLISNLKTENVTRKNRFQCPQCSEIFKKCSHFNAHIRTHISEQCHLSTHSGEQINKCPHCGQYFIDSDELVEHIRIHTGERTYSCTECSKEFGYAWQLETHIRKHTGEQPFKCPHCSQTCKNSKDLIKHIESSHSRQRLHKCPQCPKAFISVSNFKEHIKSHCMKNP